MKFHNNPAGIKSSVEAKEEFKTTSYWRHSLITAGVVNSPDWRLTYKGNYITVSPK